MRTHCIRGVIVLALSVAVNSASAEDVYYWLGATQLTIVEGKLPQADSGARSGRFGTLGRVLRPYAVLDGAGEVYFDSTDPWQFQDDHPRLAVRAEAGKEVIGSLYVPKPDWSGMVKVRFSIPQRFSSAESRGMFKDQARSAFRSAKYQHYQRLLAEGAPGAAWFRHQFRQVSIAMNPENAATPEQARRLAPGARDDLSETFALLSGGRAISENLQLDRLMPPERGRGDTSLVDVDSIDGISVPEIDWTALTKDSKPELDPLAKLVPADQHAAFFPDFNSFVRVADEARQSGTLVLRWAEPRAEDAGTMERYERQLCVSLNGLARLVGPALVRSVVLTGSDLNFRTGTDVAILLETGSPDELHAALLTQIAMGSASNREVVRAPGEIKGLKYDGARSPDRKVSCYVAKLAGAVLLTNSTYQLERFAAVAQGDNIATLAGLPEYKFFRDRYRRGDKHEAALIFLSDAAIRRWCGPRWRIASSRQLRDLAVLTELQATNIDQLVSKTVNPGPIQTGLPFINAGKTTLMPDGVHSSTLGTLDFLTPLAEMPLGKVTQLEADAYRQWRLGYQRNWSWAFDPIALRLAVSSEKLAADLTVMPLIGGSEYRQFISVSQGASIKPGAGDPHDDLLHLVMAVNTKSPTVRAGSNLATAMAPGVNLDPLSWMGDAVAVYADDDPAWEELAKLDSEKLENDFTTLAAKLPIALWVEVSSPLKAAAFMTAARAYMEQTAPGMTLWESLQYREQPYVKVTASEAARSSPQDLQNLAVFYTLSGDSLVISMKESVIQHAIDRRTERRQKKEGAQAAADVAPQAWLGENVAVRASQKFVNVLTSLTRRPYQEAMQALAWRSLPILNEWKRRYPDRDPVDVHEQVWKIRLVCPGGGKYVWNEEFQTMESTVYGHPGAPKEGPAVPPALLDVLQADFGLTFEDKGLHAKAVLERKADAKDATR